MMMVSFLSLLLITPAAAFAPAQIGTSNSKVNNAATAAARHHLSPSLLQLQASLEAILFDCDGVLADTERDGHRLAFNIAFEENGILEEWSEERYGKLLEVGGGKERMTAHWDEVGWPDQIPLEERAAKILSLHLRKTDIFMDLIDSGRIPLRRGVLRLVDEAIASGISLAVCSTSNEKAVSNLVYTLMGEERASHFQIFAGDMVRNKKPAPDVYLMAVQQMGLDKDRCVIVEDSHIGVGAAVAAGISCLVTKSSYTAEEDFTGAKMIVDELSDDAEYGIGLDMLACLLDGNENAEECELFSTSTSSSTTATDWDRRGHIETTGASWTGARLGDVSPNRGRQYTASETYSAASRARGIGADMVAHVERGGASWTGARFGEEGNINTSSATYQALGQRGLGVEIENHIEKGGASWTGARFGQNSEPNTPSRTYQALGRRGLGVDIENHIEKGGASWTGARLGDVNINKGQAYTASETRPTSVTWGIDKEKEAPIEKPKAPEMKARLGGNRSKNIIPSETYQAPQPRGLGVKMVNHIEKGGASWTGARLGDVNIDKGQEYTASETHAFKSRRKGIGVEMEAHVERGGASWTGARFGQNSEPDTPSRTYQALGQRGLGVDMENHIEKGGASWTGARLGDVNIDKGREYTASETHEFKSKSKSIGVEMEAHVEKGGASWTGARFGEDGNTNAPSETSRGLGPRGLGVEIENHIEKGGASWTGARFGQNSEPSAPSRTYQALGQRGLGVDIENHIEKGGASWTGARLGDVNINKGQDYTASETHATSAPRGIGQETGGRVEWGGISRAEASFGADSDTNTPSETQAPIGQNSKPISPSETYQASAPRSGLGVPLENHIEKGGASWTGARLGDVNPNAPHTYTASETYEFKSKGKSSGVEWDSVSHTEVAEEENVRHGYWSGARFGGEDVLRVAPTPSQWHE